MPGIRVTFESAGMEKFADGMRASAEQARARLSKLLLGAAERTAVTAKALAEPYSKTTAKTIKALPFGEGAIVQAGDGSTPLPALLERGSIFKHDPTGWRHPVFSADRKRWTRKPQRTHPYLVPALLKERRRNLEAIAEGVTELARENIE